MKTIIHNEFTERFGQESVFYASAGRINLIGEHTDYNGGYVFPGAIDKVIMAEIAPNDTDKVRVYSIDIDEYVEFGLNEEDAPTQSWARYIFGVCREILKRGGSVKGFDAVFAGNVPLGAGLSSSAALESCFAFALNDMFNDNSIDKFELARIGQSTEHNYCGVNCGIMDQFASVMGQKGKLMRLDCRSMEFVYFARPDSDIEGLNVHAFRKESGRILYRERPTEADIVIGVPDSSLSAAIGYSEESGIPYEMGLIKNKYVGRTFIQPSQELREKGVRMKLSAVRSIVKGKRVIMVDDSIVRGTTSRRIVQLLREAGASQVHVRIASPPYAHPCFYGVDTATYDELISSRLNVEELCKELSADSLQFLSVEGLYKAGKRDELCTACFSGKYPTMLYSSFEEANKQCK